MGPPAPSLADVLDRAALVLCRHGAFGRHRAEDGRVLEGLTEAGQHEAEALAAVLGEAPRPLVLYASPQPRAVATAAVLARRLELPVYTDEDLAELRLGLGAAVAEERSAVLWELARAAPDVPPLAGAESLAALQQRALATLRGARLAHAGRIVVAVTHGGLLEAVHAGLAGRPLASLGGARLEFATGACSAWAEIDGALEELARNVSPSPAGPPGRGLLFPLAAARPHRPSARPGVPVSQPLLEVSALRCERDDRLLFEALSFALGAGEALQLRGPNGAGKTTLLRCIAGLHPDHDGTIRVLGREHRAGDPARAGLLFVGHRLGVSAPLTAGENLRWHVEVGGQRADEAAVEAALERVGLPGWADVPCQQLSAGQQRRVALARLALVGPAMPLWLLDEPFTALDDRGIALVLDLLGERLRTGGAVLFTTHQPVSALPSLTTLWIGAAPAEAA